MNGARRTESSFSVAELGLNPHHGGAVGRGLAVVSLDRIERPTGTEPPGGQPQFDRPAGRREDLDVPWERTDKADALLAAAGI